MINAILQVGFFRVRVKSQNRGLKIFYLFIKKKAHIVKNRKLRNKLFLQLSIQNY